MALACRIDLMEFLFGTKSKGYIALQVFKHNFYQDAFSEFNLHFRLPLQFEFDVSCNQRKVGTDLNFIFCTTK